MKRNAKDYAHLKSDRCEIGYECLGPLDPDHVKTLASGGANKDFNIMTLCRKHHQEKGQKGIIHMAEKYYQYKLWLIRNGWEFEEFKRKWTHENTQE